MASSPITRAFTASPASRTPRNEDGRQKRNHNSPYRHSPRRSSPQVLVEEMSAVYLGEVKAFAKQQEEREAEQQRLHLEAIAQAAAEHERIRLHAERIVETSTLEDERNRKEREEEAKRQLHAERVAKSEREAAERRRRIEELEQQEKEQQRRAAEEKEIQEHQSRIAEQKRKDEAEAALRKRERELADQKAKDDAAAAAAAAASEAAKAAEKTAQPATAAVKPSQSQSTSQTVSASTSVQPAQSTPQSTVKAPTSTTERPAATNPALVSTPEQRNALHEQYLAVHKRLKTMRKQVLTQCKQSDGLKDIGDRRRHLQKLLGQFTPNKNDNRVVLKNVLQVFAELRKFEEPTIDVSPYLVSVPTDGTEQRMPAVIVYMINILVKKALAQFVSENAKIADAVSIVLATIFAKPEFKLNGTVSLIDILLAKYHMVCPILFGVYGSEKTREGRLKLGWWMEDGQFIPEENHKLRMTGLAVGYGCLSLRDFGKSTMQNPFPPPNYWKSLSYIANTPPAQIQPTHFVILKALVEDHIERFLKFYGQAAVTALRKLLVELPRSAPQSAARDVVAVLPQTLQRELSFTL